MAQLQLVVNFVATAGATKMTDKFQRGGCCHEAGHAVVLFSFSVPVAAVRVAFNEEVGWHGGTDLPNGSDDHLHYMDRITILRAGKTAEEFFDCPAHEKAWLRDFGEISTLLDRNEILHELWSRIDLADARVRVILEQHRDKALKLINRLVEYGRVNAAEFSRLMNGEATQIW
jgi:hypothetical protein